MIFVAGRTAAEKIIGRASGDREAVAGDVVEAEPDLVMSHENTFLVNKSFKEIGLGRPWDPEKIVVVLDHRTPANTLQTASVHAKIRELVKDYGIKMFYDAGEGICHQLLVEERLARPGQLVLGADSHTPTAGAIGAFAAGIGATEMAGIWATGRIWLKIPETTRLVLRNCLPMGSYAKDLALEIVRLMGPSGAEYKCIEIVGDALTGLLVSSRMALCNMSVEAGAKAAMVAPDTVTVQWYRGVVDDPLDLVRSDPDCVFESELSIDLSELPPMVSGPHRVELARPVGELEGRRVDQAFIGSCTNGRLDDLAAAAAVLKGRHVAPGCRLIVAPASRKVMEDAIDRGFFQTILSAGGTVVPPGCGPCLGAHEGVLGPGEVCISSSNRNFPGRMGSDEAEIFLASPATVAASAIEGAIADPRRYLR